MEWRRTAAAALPLWSYEMNAGAGSLINLLRGPTWQREKEERVLEETRKLVAGRIPVVYEMCIFLETDNNQWEDREE